MENIEDYKPYLTKALDIFNKVTSSFIKEELSKKFGDTWPEKIDALGKERGVTVEKELSGLPHFDNSLIFQCLTYKPLFGALRVNTKVKNHALTLRHARNKEGHNWPIEEDEFMGAMFSIKTIFRELDRASGLEQIEALSKDFKGRTTTKENDAVSQSKENIDNNIIMENRDHPVIKGKTRGKIVSITHDTGMYTPEAWKELKVELSDGVTLEKVRHQTNSFPVSEGQEILITWVIPKNKSIMAWYYSTT